MAIQTVITNKGADLIAKAISGGFAIAFVGAEIGTGTLGGGDTPVSFTALKVKHADAMLSNTLYEGNATCKFSAQYTATGLTNPVLITEIGIYATDPQLGRILFTYTNLGDNPDRLFPTDQASFYKFYDVVLSFTTTSGVTVSINPAALVPASDVTTTPVAGKLLRPDSNGKLPAGVTGSADMLGGKPASDYSLTTHAHAAATTTVAGFMSGADKTALNTLNGRVNQNLKNTDSPTFAGLTVNGVINGATFL